MGEINVRTVAGADDGYNSNGDYVDTYVNTGRLLIGPEGSASRNSPALRFVTTLPQGVTVTAARVDFITSDASDAGMNISLAIYGEDADAPAAPSSYADYLARTRTTATVAWLESGAILAGATVPTPDLTTIIQEIVDRPGFGGTLQLFIEENTSPNLNYPIYGESYDTTPAEAPLLHVEFESNIPALLGGGLNGGLNGGLQ